MIQPVFVKQVLHKTKSATARQRKFYRGLTDSELPKECDRKLADRLIKKALAVSKS